MLNMDFKLLSLIFFCCFSFNYCYEGVYNSYPSDYNSLNPTAEKPFRMKKINLVWERALVKFPKEKLKLLFTDLKYQDKEEVALKKLKTEGLDKNGMQEAMVRSSFNGLLTKYDLLKDFENVLDEVQKPASPNLLEYDPNLYMKPLFRDKKLNKLWWKAEQQGFTEQQLQALKVEFEHHQAKVDEYYSIMQNVNTGSWFKDEPKNTLDQFLYAEEGDKIWKTEISPHQLLKEKHMELKFGYDNLSNQIFWKLKNKHFEEPLVNSLWEMAQNSSFSPMELESLKGELFHFEHRIKKLKHLTDLHSYADNQNIYDDPYKRQKKLKEYNYKVDKIHRELTNRILSRHTEL